MSYSSRPLSSKLFQLTALTLALTLAGCGGGDGTDVVAPTPDIGVQPDGSGNTDNAIRAVNVSPITLTDSSGSPTRIITSTGATASVKITDAENKPISSALVTFNTDAPMSSVKFANTNGTVLTNANGIATMKLSAISATDTGSYVLTATANYNDTERQGASYFYSLQEANLIFDKVKVDENTLPYGGSTDITGLVKDSANLESQRGIEIGFEASCGSVSDTMTNILGFRTTYNAETCEGPQTVVATIKENNTSIRLPITVNQSTNLGALSIKCISGDTSEFPDSSADGSGSEECKNPVVLGAIGKSSRPSQRTIEFVVSKGDQAFAYENVKVELLNAPNDFSFGSMSNRAPKTYKTDSAGVIRVPLYAGTETTKVEGTIKDTIKVRATLISRPDVTAEFGKISVVSDDESTSSLKITPEKNVLAATSTDDKGKITELDGSTKLTATLPSEPANDTTIRFIAEGGTLSNNTCTIERGNKTCDVTLSTKGVLPNDRRVTVLAYSGVGNGTSGKYVFLDENENGKRDNGEFGLDGSDEYIYQQTIIGFADTTPTFSKTMEGAVLASSGNGTSQYQFQMFGTNKQNKNISMPSGTTISVNALDGTNNGKRCKVEVASRGKVDNELTVPNDIDLYAPEVPKPTNQTQNDSDKTYVIRTQQCAKGDKVSLIVTTPAPNRKVTTKELEFK
ncbi:hypothetical protein [Psychrobacter sp. HII-4]|uniref:hypothetical protein n=1 Tax=Psychrobacter sp. HII-4 TaxID=1569264 RepID=UPI0019189CF5|nr:hypothetical protein [Psychrobacter sp. HII-4]